MKELNEPIVPDKYPVYGNYYYIVDGEVVLNTEAGTIGRMKKRLNAKEIRLCDMVARGLRKPAR